MGTMWMVRCEGGTLYEDFREQSVVAIGWRLIANHITQESSLKDIQRLCKQAYPSKKEGGVIASASQIWRFIHEIKTGDHVVTYSSSARTYLVGQITGDWRYVPTDSEKGMSQQRAVEWLKNEIDRDDLSQKTKYHLGSTLTIFKVSPEARQELLELAQGKAKPRKEAQSLDSIESDPLAEMENLAFERIQDMLSALSWSEMQELIAGILRAMGYKTQVSSEGPDRGRDVLASPDGFGFQAPRIIVEVKHRQGKKMGSQDIRSFLGGRHSDDRGLYVSTSGFTKDARYEAERAKIPLVLWTLDDVAKTLLKYYQQTDIETKRLIPLKVVYIPA